MAYQLWASLKQLKEDNTEEEFLSAAKILTKLASNILNNPQETKYRKIRLANPTVTKLLNVAGAMECLFDMGFLEDGEFLTLPAESSLQALKEIYEELTRKTEKTTLPQNTNQTANSSPATVEKPAHYYIESEAAFLGRIKDGMRRVMRFENPSTKQLACSIIPVEELKAEAQKKFEGCTSTNNADKKSKPDLNDFLLLALLRWFKTSFFKWVDTLPCSFCGEATRNAGSLAPSSDDLKWGAGQVESHLCNSCRRITRFPRYTNAEKLLETRRGRCGEWADCFTLCCRAVGFEARFVMDWTDHVWTEVFSVSQGRWLHCDPCENVCDKPLLYESGWGKKLNYVIAVSKDEVQDVTWRYSAKHPEVLARRKLCRESWLGRTIHQLWQQKLAQLPKSQQSEMQHRLICELAGFLSVKDTGEALPGRSTGSLAWRQARGETGNTSTQAGAVQAQYVFSPTEAERESEVIHLCYSCSKDVYNRKSSDNVDKYGWQTYANTVKNVFRKEESDWKMVYLARCEGAPSAEISWKFDLKETDLRISKMELKAQSACYESGTISWRICADDNCFMQSAASLQDFMSFDLHGSSTLTITAVMSGGKGDVAWQHTQLFRQSMDDTENFPFQIKLWLN